MSGSETRSIELEQHVDASPDDVWAALTTVEGLKQWFVVDARIDPKIGGALWISWGPGSEGEAPIHAWEPGRHFGWTENYGDDAEGRPIRVVVDFEIEGGDGGTTLRLVQSGFSADAQWDEMYDALVDGWTYFLFNLAHYLGRHAGTPRALAWKRAKTELDRHATWERLVGAGLAAPSSAGESVDLSIGGSMSANVVSSRPGYHFAATLPDLDDSILFVELEGKHVGFWLSAYGTASDSATDLQSALDERIEEALRA